MAKENYKKYQEVAVNKFARINNYSKHDINFEKCYNTQKKRKEFSAKIQMGRKSYILSGAFIPISSSPSFRII